MRTRLIRTEDDQPKQFLTRGGLLTDADELRTDAIRNHQWYGFYGLSVYGIMPPRFDADAIFATKLARFHTVTMIDRGDLESAGMSLVATGKAPHFDITNHGLDHLVEGLIAMQCAIMDNDFHTIGD